MTHKNKGQIKKELPTIIRQLSELSIYFESLQENSYLHIDMDKNYLIPLEDKMKEALELVNQFWLNMK